MCGRFALTLPDDAMAQLFDATLFSGATPEPRYNIAPTQEVSVVRTTDGARRVEAMRWGFLPHWTRAPGDGPLIINARAETIAEKPAFRAACRTRRCLIPASGFFEWEKAADGARLPFHVRPRGGGLFAFAGIWQDWEPPGSDVPLRTCAIVTTTANQTISAIHDRMPVLIAPQDRALWLGEAGKGAAVLMRPAPTDAVEAFRVSKRVNGSRANDPGLIEPSDG